MKAMLTQGTSSVSKRSVTTAPTGTARMCGFAAALLFIAIFLTTGCGSVAENPAAAGAVTTTTTTAATTTTTAPTLAAQLAANSTNLDFGNVPLDTTSAPQSVTLTNSGSANLTISSISTSTSAFNTSGVPAGLVVSPGQTVTLNVTFSPRAAGIASGSVTVGTDIATASITVSGTSHAVMLSWTASTTPTVTGYNVYRAVTLGPGAFLKPLNTSPLPASTTQFEDASVQPGQTYYYVITAVGVFDLESVSSNEASGVVPTPN